MTKLSIRDKALLDRVDKLSDRDRAARKIAAERARKMIEDEIAEIRKERDEAIRDAYSMIGTGGSGMSAAAIKRAMGTTDHASLLRVVNAAPIRPWKYRVERGVAFVSRFMDWDVSLEVFFAPDGTRQGADVSVPPDMVEAVASDSETGALFADMLDDIKDALS